MASDSSPHNACGLNYVVKETPPRTEQKGSAWTLGLFACRRNSQVAPTAPGSGAAANQKSRASEALESQRRTSP